MDKGKKSDFNGTLKSQDTEEWLDVVFTRPIGYRWALFFNKFKFISTANIWFGIFIWNKCPYTFC